jgi:uncharacterized protein
MNPHIRTSAPVHRQSALTDPDISRRSLLRSVFLGLGAASLPTWVVKAAHAQQMGGTELDIPFGPLGAQDFGELVAQVVEDDLVSVNHQLFAPEGFGVRVVMRAGINPVTKTAEGTMGHNKPDGGAVYGLPDGGWVYTSNSEATPGGVSALRFGAAGELVDYYRICSGTRNNCAGGKTPWETWITCEEVTGGFAYECDPVGSPETQRRLDALGARNSREAVAIDPIHHVCYQTLDTSSGKFVRFVSSPEDLEVLPNGVTRMRMQLGESQRLRIAEFNDLPAFDNVVVPNNATGSQQLRPARPIEWVADTGTNGTNFNGAEGLWYYEIPEPLRTIPTAGTVPTRGVIFFASKGDNRLWAIDIDNELIELLYDIHNSQAFDNLRNMDGAPSNFNQVDNVVVSPGGDVLVAEDGTAMRLAIMFNNLPAKLLLQITRGGSEICGPAFTPDGSRLYFASQSGPSGAAGTGSSGVIYEMTIPPRFRAIQSAAPFGFEERLNVAPAVTVTSEEALLDGFYGPLTLTISEGSDAEFSVNDGEWTNLPTTVFAGDSVRVRHTSSANIGEVTETVVAVGLENGASRTDTVFYSVTSEPDTVPDPFDFGTQTGVVGNTLIDSEVITLTGFNLPTDIVPGPHAEYRIDGGEWTTVRGTLEPGQTLQMRHLSNKPHNSVRRTHLRVGGVTGHFTTRTGGRCH